MKVVTIFFEYLAGIVGAIINACCMVVAGFVGLFELPRYFRIRSK